MLSPNNVLRLGSRLFKDNVRLFTASSVASETQVSCQPLDGPYENVSVLKLDRPSAKNALGHILLSELKDALNLIRQEQSTRVLIITSDVEGVFSAGADLKERAVMTQQESKECVNQLRMTMNMISDLPMPTIALIEGLALGGGAELALACDIRICSPEAIFAWPETALGIIPGAGGTQRLPRLVGLTKAMDILLTGRRVSAQEAFQIGLVNSISASSPLQDAQQYAATIAANAPLAVRAAKAALVKGHNTDLSTALHIEEQCYSQVLNTTDRMEGLMAFKEKRKPRYTGS